MIKKLFLLIIFLFSSSFVIQAEGIQITSETILIHQKKLYELTIDFLEQAQPVKVNTQEKARVVYNKLDVDRIIKMNKTGNHFVKVYVFINQTKFITTLRVLVHEGSDVPTGSYPISLHYDPKIGQPAQETRLLLLSSHAVINANQTHAIDAYDVYTTKSQLQELVDNSSLNQSLKEFAWVKVFSTEATTTIKTVQVDASKININKKGIYPVRFTANIDNEPLSITIRVYVLEESYFQLPESIEEEMYYIKQHKSTDRQYWRIELAKYVIFVNLLILPLFFIFKQSRLIKKMLKNTTDVVEGE